MLKNYLKIAIRQLRKQKMYAAIKIGGFALGIAACLLIALYIRDETSYDKSYPDADRIYRLVGFFAHDGKIEKDVSWPAPMSKAVLSDMPDVEYCGRMMPNSLIGHAGADELRPIERAQNTYEKGFAYIDQSTLDIFQLPMVYGKRDIALKKPYTMVITKSMADKYYPGQNPVGKVMVLDNDKDHLYRIGGVIADIPSNSHLHPYNFFLTLSKVEFWNGEQNNWGDINYPIYIKVRAEADVAQLQKKLSHDLLYNYFLPSMKKDGQVDAEKLVSEFSIHLQPVKDINLYSYDIEDGLSHGDIRFTWLFGAIAVFILVIACINFINLATARSANRAKEVGLRKVVGSYRSSLINQFLTESLVYSLISFIMGILIAWLILPYFNELASKSLVMPWAEWWFVPVILISALIVGTFAGLYPAFYLSSFRPVQVLKGSISSGSKSPLLRNSLVVFQFTASIILIISTIVIYSQTHFILNRKVGFDKDQVMVLQGTNTMGDKNAKDFKNDLSKITSIKSVSISDYLPVNGAKRNGNTFFKEGREKLDAGVGGQYWQIDDTYLKTLGMKLVEGRNFSYDISSDTAGRSLIINQTMAKKLNLKNPVGKLITNGYGHFLVIGVVQDFNFESMRGDIEPLALHFGLSPSMMTIKFKGGDVQNTIANVSALWKKYSPDQPIRYTFLDQEFAHMYADVERTGSIFTSFAVLAVIIACLGLFALSAFMAEQRSKEIGIRKVLGASVQGITTLLSMDFVKLVLLAIVIASPIAFWGMNKWLQDFAYRIQINWWMFAAAGLGAIFIALITVSFQSVKAALANPIKSLRSE
ncbi:MAG TPA: ABC transporter permease [Mucilaginibacter sp.]|nr:ABC transporter permease [Mucilaginibacter sp.]